MKVRERYAQARATVGAADRAMMVDFASRRFPETIAIRGVVIAGVTHNVIVGDELGLDGIERHVSMANSSRSRLQVPSWDALVAVRACLWPDDAEVTLPLPSAAGDTDWVNVAEALHMWGPAPEVAR